jgi:hypothetical protein
MKNDDKKNTKLLYLTFHIIQSLLFKSNAKKNPKGIIIKVRKKTMCKFIRDE